MGLGEEPTSLKGGDNSRARGDVHGRNRKPDLAGVLEKLENMVALHKQQENTGQEVLSENWLRICGLGVGRT